MQKSNSELKNALDEEKGRTSGLEKEIAMFEELCKSLKLQKEAYTKERDAANEVIEGLKSHRDHLKANLEQLGSGLNDQVALNKELDNSLEESMHMNNVLRKNLEEMTKSSEEHENALKELREQLDKIQGSQHQVAEIQVDDLFLKL